jgi:hypothetical protein
VRNTKQSLITLAFILFSAPVMANHFCGDQDRNGKVQASDALAILKAAVGNTNFCKIKDGPDAGDVDYCACDVNYGVNPDGKITASDALLVLKAAVGQNVTLDCGCTPVTTTTTSTSTSTSTSTTTSSTSTSTTLPPDYYPTVRYLNNTTCGGFSEYNTLEAHDYLYNYDFTSYTGYPSDEQSIYNNILTDFYVDRGYPCSDISGFNGYFDLYDNNNYEIELSYSFFYDEYTLSLYYSNGLLPAGNTRSVKHSEPAIQTLKAKKLTANLETNAKMYVQNTANEAAVRQMLATNPKFKNHRKKVSDKKFLKRVERYNRLYGKTPISR